MATITFEGRVYDCAPGETVLSALLRAGVAIPNSCRAGVCQSCILRAESGAVPERAQAGLKDSLRVQGYFLACSCVPDGDMVVSAGAPDLRVSAIVEDLALLSPTVMRVRARCESAFEFSAGQYVSLRRRDGLSRSYSIASLPREGFLEFHVRRVPGGRMSTWIHDELRAGERIEAMGPAGSCFYVPGRADQPLILAGTGTGLAPLWGIARDALERGHTGPAILFHGGLDPSGLYLRGELRDLERSYPNFSYRPCVLNANGEDLPEGALDKIIRESCPATRGWRAFVCGDPNIVKTLQRTLFLAGASMKDIFADSFLPSPS